MEALAIKCQGLYGEVSLSKERETMNTIEERIEAVVESHSLLDSPLTSTLLREMLWSEFVEPWLDAPDGPGHRWFRGPTKRTRFYRVVKIDERRDALAVIDGMVQRSIECFAGQWQRVIGPSEGEATPTVTLNGGLSSDQIIAT